MIIHNALSIPNNILLYEHNNNNNMYMPGEWSLNPFVVRTTATKQRQHNNII